MTTHTRFPTQADFEAELRAMLQRRAADVHPSRATARMRIADAEPAGTPTISLTHPRDLRRATSRTVAHRRPLLAAAAALVVVLGGVGVAIGGRSDGDSTTVGTGPIDGVEFPAPGFEGWYPSTAPPVWPVVGMDAVPTLLDDADLTAGLDDPTRAAEAYLSDVAPLTTVIADRVSASSDGITASVPWQLGDPAELEPGHEPTYVGTIHLRDVGDGIWVVVGAVTEGVTVEDVATDGHRLGFTATASAADAGDSFSFRARVDDEWVSVGGESLPRGGLTPVDNEPDPEHGELVALAPGNSVSKELPVDPGSSVEILVRHVGGDMLSVTHMAVDVPVAADIPDQPSATTTPSTGRDAGAVAEPRETTPERGTTEPTTPDGGATDVEPVAGTYQGMGHYSLTDGRCPDLDHVLDLTFELADGSTWSFRAEYCGALDGDLWTGRGDFVLTTVAGDTITGTLESSAVLPTDGEPFELTVTGGSGSYAGASGTCALDNHLVPVGLGTQKQFGDFACEISP